MIEYRKCRNCGGGLNVETISARVGYCYDCVYGLYDRAKQERDACEGQQWKDSPYWRRKLAEKQAVVDECEARIATQRNNGYPVR